MIDGFTGDQRFFIAYAQAWATKMREAALRQRIATDGHAPGNYRALTVRNLDAWYDAFDVKEGDKLYLAPEQARADLVDALPPAACRWSMMAGRAGEGAGNDSKEQGGLAGALLARGRARRAARAGAPFVRDVRQPAAK